MYAPAPRWTWTRKEKPLPRMSRPSQPRSSACGDRALQPACDPLVLAADVDEPLAGADGVAGQRQPFQQQVRVALHQDAVLERPRLRLVGVADDVFLAGLSACGDHPPLAAGREAGSPAPASPIGPPRPEWLPECRPARRAEGLIGPGLDGAIERIGIDLADAGHGHPHLAW